MLCCTPSYALYLADAIKDSGLPREEFQLKVGAFGAEPWTENMRHEIEENLGIKAYDIYGLSEIAGPGVGYECECQHGTHLNEDHYVPKYDPYVPMYGHRNIYHDARPSNHAYGSYFGT